MLNQKNIDTMKTLVRKNRPIWNEFPLMFDDLMNEWSTGSQGTFTPAVNIKESGEEFVLELSVPGFGKDDINVTIEDQRITISSELEKEENSEAEGYTRREFMKRSFERSFTLPKGVINSDKVKANYENGILLITLPKLDEVKPKPAKRLKIG
ncbi:MAG: Hsp20/alpha crystallin family protein [Salibacteraceae bacterium]